MHLKDSEKCGRDQPTYLLLFHGCLSVYVCRMPVSMSVCMHVCMHTSIDISYYYIISAFEVNA